jgi:hypothetical protein
MTLFQQGHVIFFIWKKENFQSIGIQNVKNEC